MKKLFILIALCMLMAGCSSNSAPEQTQSTSTTSTTEETTPPETTTPESTEESAEEFVFTRGSVTDGVYSNESLGINITVPTGFVALSDEQLNSLVTTSADSKGIDNFQEAIDSQVVTYDFGMVDGSGNGSVLVGIENLALEGAEGLVNNESEYLAFVTANLSADPNAAYTFSDVYEFDGLQDTWYAVDCIESNNQVNSIILVKYLGKYVATIIYNYTEGTDPSAVLSQIS